MQGELTQAQCTNILLSQAMGRIGCIAGKRPYIVPITYVYDGEDIYGQTHEGLKLNMMRRNKNVCFQVDLLTDISNWQSVIVTGTFHELKGKKITIARTILNENVYTLMTGTSVHPHEHAIYSKNIQDDRIKPIVYKIKVKKITGRFEHP